MLLRYALLALLSDRELHGYAIKAAFARRMGPFWVLNFGQIYQGLKHLKGRRLVSARFDAGSGHLGRWVYAISPKGRNALATWLRRSPRAPELIRNEIFIRLLACSRDVDEALCQIARQERVYREHLVQCAPPTGLEDEILASLIRDAEVFRAEAHLRWLEHCSATLARWHHSGARSLAASMLDKINLDPADPQCATGT